MRWEYSTTAVLYFCTDFSGFSVFMVSTQYPNSGDILEFFGVNLNVGSGYGTDTHRYTCPTSGYYYFYYSLYADLLDSDNPYCSIQITMDGTNLAAVILRQCNNTVPELRLCYCTA